MSNEGFKPDQKVLDEVETLAYKLYQKIAGSICGPSDDAPELTEPGKKVIGFGFFVYHEDGSIATDAIGYWDRERVQSRMNNFLMQLSIVQAKQVTDAIFFPDDGKTRDRERLPLTNEEARPALWRGF